MLAISINWLTCYFYSYYVWYIINEKVHFLLVSLFGIFGSILWPEILSLFKKLLTSFTNTSTCPHACLWFSPTSACKHAHTHSHPPMHKYLLWMWLTHTWPHQCMRAHIIWMWWTWETFSDELPMEALFVCLPWTAYSTWKEIKWAMFFITSYCWAILLSLSLSFCLVIVKWSIHVTLYLVMTLHIMSRLLNSWCFFCCE